MKVHIITSLIIVSHVFLGCTPAPDPDALTSSTDEPPTSVTFEGTEGPGQGTHIVLVAGDEEYRSEEALPQLAQILSHYHGFTSTVLFAQDPDDPGRIDPNNSHHIPGLESLESADLMVIFTRFRALPDESMSHIQQYLMEGKPVIGIRTATHAFEFNDSTSAWNHWSNSFRDETSPWHDGFGRLVLGERWHTHHGHHKHQSSRGLIAPTGENHPVANGINDGDIWGSTDVYGLRFPLAEGVTPIILGQVINREDEYDENDVNYGMKPTDSEVATVNPATSTPYNPNDPMMPLAWTKPYQLPDGQPGMAFTSTIGSSTDMESEGVRRLFVNAVYYLLGMDVPEAATVDIVGTYNPTAYNFHSDEYWVEKNLRVSDYVTQQERP